MLRNLGDAVEKELYYTLEVYEYHTYDKFPIRFLYIALARDSLCLRKLIHYEGENKVSENYNII